MGLLYDKKEVQTNEFYFKPNTGRELKSSDFGDKVIKITYINKKLDKVEHDIPYMSVDASAFWKLMKAIAEQIEQIDLEMNAPTCLPDRDEKYK